MKKNCIMLKTKDGKIFFTEKKHLQKLINFANKLECEFFLAKTVTENILSLKKLIKMICNGDYLPKNNYTILKPITLKQQSIKEDIKTTIASIFFKGEQVSLKRLKNEFKNHKLSDPSLCNYIKKVKEDLTEKGFFIEKLGTSYKIVKK